VVAQIKFSGIEGTMLNEATITAFRASLRGGLIEPGDSRWLRDKGVVLEKYPFVQDRELGIWTTPTGDKVAWFKDPDGNILSVSQHH
jgi:hypothetical protein